MASSETVPTSINDDAEITRPDTHAVGILRFDTVESHEQELRSWNRF